MHGHPTATKWNVGNALGCTLGSEKQPRNQDLKGDIYICIYISMLLFIKTLFSNKKLLCLNMNIIVCFSAHG